MTQIHEALQWGTHRLATAGVASPRLDANLLMAEALGLSREALLSQNQRPLASEEEASYKQLLSRREHREPLSHITGKREFWSLNFYVNDNVLDPRPDSETLIETTLRHIEDKNRKLKILDLGTGSGCLLLTLLSELPDATGHGVDISEAALSVARRNAASLKLGGRVEWALRDWSQGIEGSYDIIVSNPPYISTPDIAMLQPEVRNFEPFQALYGGPDGLNAYRELAKILPALLAPEGFAVLEIGARQDEPVIALFTQTGLVPAGRFHDLAGVERCLMFTHPKKELHERHEHA